MIRNIILLFCFISVSITCNSQYRDDTLLLSSSKYADLGGGYVIPYDSIAYTYDNQGNCLSALYLSFNFGSRVGYITYKSVYTYNSDNRKTSFVSYDWNSISSSFDIRYRISYFYNANHQITSELMENWNGANYVNDEKTVYLYNQSNQLITLNKMGWNGTSFSNLTSHVFTYDANGNRITDKAYESDFSVLKTLDVYIYDANNQLLNDSMLYWDNASSAYTEMYVSYFGYNNLGEKNYISRKRFDHQKSFYINEYEDSFYYNSKHQCETIIAKIWNTTTGKFERDQRYLYTYSYAGKISKITTQTWNSINFITEDIEKFYYGTSYNHIGDWASIYPVPASDFLNVELLNFPGGVGSMVVYCEITDITGRLVTKVNLIDAFTEINVGYFGKGVYTICLQNGDQRISSKFVKL